MLAPISYIQGFTTIRRRRQLPVEGQILVKVGDVVHSSDPVARANLEARHLILDAARALGLPPERAAKTIQRSVGEEVEEGAIIAGRRGVGNRQLRAPAAGKVSAISGSQILLQVSDVSSMLLARIPGQVIDINPGIAVTIECIGAWVQAVWGNGQLADGVLQSAGENSNQVLTPDQIDMSQRGAILVAGICEHKQALELAAQVPIRGLVLGSLSIKLLPTAEKMPYPIVLIEGFGNYPINRVGHELLIKHRGDAATINAQKLNPLSGDRPEVIIPIRDTGKPPQSVPLQRFRLGQTVRVIAGKHRSLTGRIMSLPAGSTYYPSGVHAPGASVELPGKGEVVIPVVNLELLG